MQYELVICNAELHGATDQWVQLLPAGTFRGRDGRGPYRADVAAILAAWEESGREMPVDYNHQMLDAEAKRGPVPAAGWITELEAREDGVWGRAVWTDTAAAAIKAKEYKYLSPVIRAVKDTGVVVQVLLAGLTNLPNFQMAAVTAHEVEMNKEILERMMYVLNLPLTSTDAEVVAELEKIVGRLKTAEETVEANAQALKTQAKELEQARAGLKDINVLVNEITPDPSKWAPVEQLHAMAQRLGELETSIHSRAVAEAVGAAMTAGKIPPALEQWAKDYATKDLAGFDAYVAAMPALVGAHGMSLPKPDASGLSPEQREINQMMGISEDAWKAHGPKE